MDHGKSKGGPEKKKIYFCFIDYAKVLTVVITINCRKFLKRWVYQTCLLGDLYEGQEATVRTRHGITEGSKLGKVYDKAVRCHPFI